MFVLNYKHICIFVIIVLILWILISILRAAMKKRKPVPVAQPKYYQNNVGNGTRMVIGGFSHPNYLFAMNRVPYDGPL
jgi:hypothetical protein